MGDYLLIYLFYLINYLCGLYQGGRAVLWAGLNLTILYKKFLLITFMSFKPFVPGKEGRPASLRFSMIDMSRNRSGK